MSKVIRIGGASGFWGESSVATPQLLKSGNLDYLVYDYLAEVTMSIMARARDKDPALGYAVDFVTSAMKSNLSEIAKQGVKVVANAGGVNPLACVAALEKVIAEAGLDLKVGVVTGDDLYPQLEQLAANPPQEMFSGEGMPDAEKIASMNAYLGALPIASALDRGADIVVTGRCVDSAVTLGACIHEFGWDVTQLDAMAGASLAGHIIECGPQATGGNYTDWEEIADSLPEVGYPIAEVSEDGSFVCTKPENTGGAVTVGTVSEQMLYEIGDPQAYILPDVVCDFSGVEMEVVGDDRVLVKGAKGYAPTTSYKVSATYSDGFRGGALYTMYGPDAGRKAQIYTDNLFKRVRTLMNAAGLPDFTETSVEVLGAEAHYGSAKQVDAVREVTVKFAAKHPSPKGIGLLLKESTGMALSAPPGLTIFAGGRPKPSPVVRLFSFLVDKKDVPIQVAVAGDSQDFVLPEQASFDPAQVQQPEQPAQPDLADTVEVPLVKLAWGRSGDKGNKANIGIIARKPEYFPYIAAALTEEFIAQRLAHFLEVDDVSQVQRFIMPGMPAMNFLIDKVLGGGGVASIRTDAQGKGYAQLIIDHPIAIPKTLAEAL